MMRMFVLIRWRDGDDECTCGHKMKEACNDENVRVNKMRDVMMSVRVGIR